MRARIIDVAKAAGVSKKTVSRVINNETGVHKETRNAVNAAIKSLNYIPNINALRFRNNQSFLVGVVHLNCASNSYCSNVVKGIVQACDTMEYDVLIKPLDDEIDNSTLLSSIEKMIARSNADGFIILPPLCDNKALVQFLDKSAIPFVRVATADEDEVLPIYSEEVKGAHLATEHLLNIGHTEIAFIDSLDGHAASKWRRHGFEEALNLFGLSANPDWIISTGSAPKQIEKYVRQLLSAPVRPTAAFVTNDACAAVVYRVAKQLKLKIPHDLSIIGFDDDPLADSLWPPLTTVRQPITELGVLAATTLIQHCIKQSDRPVFKLPLPEVVLRHSTTPLLA